MYAGKKYPSAEFIECYAEAWNTDRKFDTVVCAGGVHHLPLHIQESFIARCAGFLKPNGIVIMADPHIGEYSYEESRQVAAVELGARYLIETIKAGGSPEIIRATDEIITNDIFQVEWKTSVSQRREILKRHYKIVQEQKMWPSKDTSYGDWCFVLRPK